jgi:hypothetical protein
MSQLNNEAEHSAIAQLFAKFAHENEHADESAYLVICFVGQLACIEAERGNKGAIKIACRCYTELDRAEQKIPPMLRQFILKRIDMVADGQSKKAFPVTNNRANRPCEFDGLGFAFAVLRRWIDSDIKPENFKAFISNELNGEYGLCTEWGGDFDVETLRRSLKRNLPFAVSLLELTPA